MANPSFAEIKERFNKMNVLPYHKPRSSSIDRELTSDSSASEKPKNDPTKQSSNNILPRSITPSNTTLETSKEIVSVQETKFAQSRSNQVSSLPLKQPPIPPPRPILQRQNEKISSEISSGSQKSTSSQFVSMPNTFVSPSEPEDDTYMEVTSDFSDPSYSSDISELENIHQNVEQSCVSLPIPLIPNQSGVSPLDSRFVSLDALLPKKCMFYEHEYIINGYQRRDPRTILYPKMKATMPKMTSVEINTLQRYSNT